ncbi:hypothetical protein GW17_00028397 [Ensete ventricosum]|nr:hypothetical protein GW17_00028397 [Ensete ventricosum]
MCGTHSHSCHSEERRPHTCGTLQTESPTRLPCEGERGGENSGGRCRRRDASEEKPGVARAARPPFPRVICRPQAKNRSHDPSFSPCGEERGDIVGMMDNNSTTENHVYRNSCCMDWIFGANILHAIAGAGVLAGCNKLQLLIFGKKYGSGCA